MVEREMVPYDLAATADRILGPTLLRLGLPLLSAGETDVAYSDGERALSLSYYREDLPRPWLSTSVGRSDAPGAAPRLVALWRAFPESAELQDPEVMRFDSQQVLESKLALVRDEWVPTYVLPLLQDDGRLWSSLADQEQEVREEYEKGALRQQLLRARRAYDAGDHEAAVLAYALCPEDALSAADRRRLAMARRGLPPTGAS